MSQFDFHKYEALGNDMLVIDPADFSRPLTPASIRLLCHRHFGLGADGICFGPLLPADEHTPGMRFYNPDGSEAEKSGNGLRIFARYLWDRDYVTGRVFEVQMGEELIQVRIQDEQAQIIATTLGQLSFHSSDIPVTGRPREVVEEAIAVDGHEYRFTAVSIGNPHCVIFGQVDSEQVTEAFVRAVGPVVESSPLFPNRTNVQFARVIDQHTIQVMIWERGAGYTLASGSSASAAAGAAIKTARCKSPVEVGMAGGKVQVTVDEAWGVTLTGEVRAVGRGNFAQDLLNRAF